MTGSRPPRPGAYPHWCDTCTVYHPGRCPLSWNSGHVPGHADMRGSGYGRHTRPIRPFDRDGGR